MYFYPTEKKISPEPADEELIESYRATRDRELVGILYKRYTRLVFLVCMKYLGNEEDAKDAAMQVFEGLFDDLLRHEVRNFRPWIHTVARNHCLMQIRSNRPAQEMAAELKKEGIPVMESGYELHPEDDHEHRLKELEDAILMLSKEQRVCIELFYLKKMPYREITEITGQSYDQVKSHIQNGKRNLKILLTKDHER